MESDAEMTENAAESRPRPRVLVTRRLPADVEARLRTEFSPLLYEDGGPIGLDKIAAEAEKADALLITGSEKMTGDAFAALPKSIRIVATLSVGTDHIDLDAARKLGFVVTNTPDVLTDATADITLLVMLGAARRAYEGQKILREGRWTGWAPTQFLGTDLRGKRLGVLGMGRIGQAVAARARAFGMKIHYHNRRPVAEAEALAATYHDTVESLLRVSDVLSLNCPGTPETHHLINDRTIDMMPPNAILVNTARGSVVDDEALIRALKSGRLQSAGLDVFEGEPKVNPGYFDIDNCYILPHMGSATVETRNAMGFCCLDNIAAYFSGQEPPARVA